MRSAVERGRDYRKIVSVSIAASTALHALVLGLGRVHVDLPGESPAREPDTRVVELASALQVIVIEPEAAEPPRFSGRHIRTRRGRLQGLRGGWSFS